MSEIFLEIPIFSFWQVCTYLSWQWPTVQTNNNQFGVYETEEEADSRHEETHCSFNHFKRVNMNFFSIKVRIIIYVAGWSSKWCKSSFPLISNKRRAEQRRQICFLHNHHNSSTCSKFIGKSKVYSWIVTIIYHFQGGEMRESEVKMEAEKILHIIGNRFLTGL